MTSPPAPSASPSGSASRPVTVGLAALSLFLLCLTVVPAKPGLPTNLKADEPAYYLMAWSLAVDHDLRCDVVDVNRLFREFPLSSTRNLVLMSDDGWHTAFFGKPFIYPLVAAPFVAVFGGNGLLFTNMLLTLLMVWLGTRWLSRDNEPWLAALFAVGFFLVSTSFVYVFWLQPEVFNMAAVMVSLYLGLGTSSPAARVGVSGSGGQRGGQRRGQLAALASGAALSLAAYNKPVVLAVALPVLWQLWRERRWRGPLLWGVGCGGALALLAVVSIGLTGHPTAYLGVTRMGVEIEQPGVLPFQPEPPATAAVAPPAAAAALAAASAPLPGAAAPAAAVAPPGPTDVGGAPPPKPGNSWWWIFRFPDLQWAELREDLGNFLVGRHTGLLWYHPFAVLACVLFVAHRRRDSLGWLNLLGLAIVALFFLIWIPWNYQGGGGFVGNRYFVNVYPAFLFLVGPIRPRHLVPAVFALGGLLLGPVLFMPFGAPVAWTTLQAHVRNFPYPLFPLELSLRNLPGYESVKLGGIKIFGRRDVFLPRGDSIWLGGGDNVEVWLSSGEPLHAAAFRVRNLAGDNRIRLRMGGHEEAVDAAELAAVGAEKEVRFTLDEPTRVSVRRQVPTYYYRLRVDSTGGEIRTFTVQAPPPTSHYFAYTPSWEDNFYVGAVLVYLGDGSNLDLDVYHARWGSCTVPPSVRAGTTFAVDTVVTNTSGATWTASGAAAQIKLAYHWRGADGSIVVLDGLRTPLPGDVAPGQTVTVSQTVRAPDSPGHYQLELDLLFEFVSWFGDKNGGQTYRSTVEVTP